MALSMDEQRMLAEIERRLAAEDPGLAARLSSFRRPGPATRLRTTRGRIIGSLFTIALVAVVSLLVYAMVPFRAHSYKPTTTQSSSPAASAQVRSGPPASAAAETAAAKTSASPKTAP
jgi:cytoskeletal protein RodZ